MEEILRGTAPNAGRFCGYCYHPLADEASPCPHCDQAPAERPPVKRIPAEVLAMFRAQRSREAWVVRTIAYGGLGLGIGLGLLPIGLADATWWTILAFFAILGFFYLFSATLANTIGDAIGYRWGQRVLEKRWREFVAERQRA